MQTRTIVPTLRAHASLVNHLVSPPYGPPVSGHVSTVLAPRHDPPCGT
ncbi:hypothetical protein [Streptomyces sp. NPDC012508]